MRPNNLIWKKKIYSTPLDFDNASRYDCNTVLELLSREGGEPLHPKTKVVYILFIDMKPDTIMTVMTKAEKNEIGQNFILFTADQHIYKVAVQIKSAYPSLFPNCILRLGGMHMIISFIANVGILMAVSGLANVLEPVFGSVEFFFSGKKFPLNTRALRSLTEELLREIINQDNANSHDNFLIF